MFSDDQRNQVSPQPGTSSLYGLQGTSSNGYMGQGLRRIDGVSDINSTSFYSNSTSLHPSSVGLNNSRYIGGNRKRGDLPTPGVGKVMPIAKSIDGQNGWAT